MNQRSFTVNDMMNSNHFNNWLLYWGWRDISWSPTSSPSNYLSTITFHPQQVYKTQKVHIGNCMLLNLWHLVCRWRCSCVWEGLAASRSSIRLHRVFGTLVGVWDGWLQAGHGLHHIRLPTLSSVLQTRTCQLIPVQNRRWHTLHVYQFAGNSVSSFITTKIDVELLALNFCLPKKALKMI